MRCSSNEMARYEHITVSIMVRNLGNMMKYGAKPTLAVSIHVYTG